jgi:hypothetical protein
VYGATPCDANPYGVPLISPLISQVSGPVVQMHWAPSGEAVTWYEVTGASLVAGCSHDTVADAV